MDTSYLFDMPSLYNSCLLIVFSPLSICVTFFGARVIFHCTLVQSVHVQPMFTSVCLPVCV